MFIQTRTIEVTKGNSDKVIERFSKESPIDQFEGLIDRTVMVNKRAKNHEEVVMMIRWRSQEDWKNWEKSDVHLQGHRNHKGKEKPEYIIGMNVNMYEVHYIKEGN
ncbi:heme oxygenase (staphylobilin-producing) [Natronobacillus azotifigens]|uniref:Antibiotic biosynthesis monooxygenase n=1 Tax=Natronobacillus azotifigens TaxID=472978 RepID=A0A9J6RGC4_9BACI|nr:antibiotic biosynthesis monooxygenase [Natronobacillus azotifigens]MCZ0704209.1 antibiotic biosynthesis monooxygenase [Natronobacillus azotifigens]